MRHLFSFSPGFRSGLRLACFSVFLAVGLWAQGTGVIEGRITNPSTGGVLEHARIAVVGSNVETLSDSDGFYRLNGVTPGIAQLRVFFSGFPTATAAVNVAAGQTVQQDFQLTPLASRASGRPNADGSVVKLDEFVVATS